MGFTEAELGFFIALLLLLVFVLSGSRNPAPPGLVPAATADTLRDSLTSLQARIDSMIQQRLRSRTKPSCIEKRLAAGPLFRVEVLSADSVREPGRTITVSGLKRLHATDLARADSVGCVHVIEVSAAPALAAQAYHAAIQRLRRDYYVDFARH